MKYPRLQKQYPLVAIILISIAICSTYISFQLINKSANLMGSNEELIYSADNVPRQLIEGRSDYLQFYSVPELQTLRPFYENFSGNKTVKIIPEINEHNKNSKSKIQQTPFYIQVDNVRYKQDVIYNAKIEPIKKNRNLAIISSYGTGILFYLSTVIVSLCIAFALLTSHKKGYLVKRNINLIRISSFFIVITSLFPFIAKALFIYVETGSLFPKDEIPSPWIDLMKFSVIPTLLVLGTLVGITHIVCQNMRNSIAMKEDIDGTI